VAYQASPTSVTKRKDARSGGDSSVVPHIVALFLGIAVAVMALIGLWLAISASQARDDAEAALAKVEGTSTAAPAGHVHGVTGEAAVASPSFAGMAPENADAIATAHQAYPAAMPALQPGPVVNVKLGIDHGTVSIAPGIQYEAWKFSTGAPGPVIHVRQGQRVNITMTNNAPMPHSIDFHAARIAPNVAFRDIAPGETFKFSFVANDPGVFMYHCGTKPVLAHIANGMYGAIVVEPKAGLPPVDHQYVLVSSEWYLGSSGLDKPASLDMTKAHERTPDWVTWNGYAAQYVKHPLTADPGDTVRFWIVAAGPSFDTAFHVVGTILNRAWVNQDMTQYQRGVQTVLVPAGGGGVFDVKIDEPGLYPFVSHSFASVDMGQVGLLKVGNPPGTMSH
jgi:nitrite reductase (NO-forming)